MSSFYKPAGILSIIHGNNNIRGMRVAPYSAEQRRPIGYYAAPFLVSGLLIVAFFMLALRSTSNWLPLLIIGALGAAAMAEISRSFVNYTYDYHGIRVYSSIQGLKKCPAHGS